MERRACKRIPASIKVEFCCGNKDYSGTITNLSENGMFISTRDISFPFESKFEIAIPLEEEVLNIPVKISRLLKTGDIYDGMGVVILNIPKKYLELLIKLNLGCQS